MNGRAKLVLKFKDGDDIIEFEVPLDRYRGFTTETLVGHLARALVESDQGSLDS